MKEIVYLSVLSRRLLFYDVDGPPNYDLLLAVTITISNPVFTLHASCVVNMDSS